MQSHLKHTHDSQHLQNTNVQSHIPAACDNTTGSSECQDDFIYHA